MWRLYGGSKVNPRWLRLGSSIWDQQLPQFVSCTLSIFSSYSFGAIRFTSASILRARFNSTKILYQELIFHDVAILDCIAPKPHDLLMRAAEPSMWVVRRTLYIIRPESEKGVDDLWGRGGGAEEKIMFCVVPKVPRPLSPQNAFSIN